MLSEMEWCRSHFDRFPQISSQMPSPALILIDVQRGFDDPKWGVRNNPDAEKNISRLLEAWRSGGRPVIHIQHRSTEPNSPLRPDCSGCEFKPEATPLQGEAIFGKEVNSAFIGTSLEAYLRENGIADLVIAGLTTDHCVSTTTRMAGNLGFSAILVSDATATFNRKGLNGENIIAEDIHKIHLSSLNGEFCRVLATNEVLASFV